MASSSETGIAPNIANFKSLIGYGVSFDSGYQPSNELITIINLKKLLEDTSKEVDACDLVEGIWTKAINDREIEFDKLDPLVTRVINIFESCGASQQAIDNARSLVNKLRGTRSKKKLTDEEIAALKAEGKEYNPHSTSQLSFDNRLSNFGKLIDVIEPETKYTPNEEDLTLTALKGFKKVLSDANENVSAKSIALSGARAKRNAKFNDVDQGMVDVADTAKKYIKGVYGAKSTQFKAVAALKFRRIK